MSACPRRFESFGDVISSFFHVHALNLGSHAGSREWTDYDERCGKAGMPNADRFFATKNALAWEMEVWVLMSRRANGEIKYSLSNAPKETVHAELATRQEQCHFVEPVFEDAKSELGVGEYQVPKWKARHHHMALVGMAMAFAFEEKFRLEPGSPLISTRDVVDMVAWVFTGEANHVRCRSHNEGVASTSEIIHGLQDSEGMCSAVKFINA